ALETIVNIIAAFVMLFIIKTVLEPADENHPYGHGKLEFFSAAFEGGLVVFASLVIVFEAIKSLREGRPLMDLSVGMVYVGIATGLNA
ncbi:MAG: cation transporter, partial [Bdellovibrionota bacterium]